MRKCGGFSDHSQLWDVNVFHHCWQFIPHTGSVPSKCASPEASLCSSRAIVCRCAGRTQHNAGGSRVSGALASCWASTAVQCPHPPTTTTGRICTVLLLNPHWTSLGPLRQLPTCLRRTFAPVHSADLESNALRTETLNF